LKKILALVLTLALLAGAVSATAATVIDPNEARNISISEAGYAGANEVPGYSPTTGRSLAALQSILPNGFGGLAATGRYMPFMVQITNGNAGTGARMPLNASYADIVYQIPLYKNGFDRMSMIYSDFIPDYVGFVRSTRLTHIRIRQEWDCAYVTSGYSAADVPGELDKLGITQPDSLKTQTDPGLIYVGDYRSRPWGPYSRRLAGKGAPADPDNEVFELANLLANVVPADYVPRSHAFRFTDELPAAGDDANTIYVDFGYSETYSWLTYQPETNTYLRHVKDKNGQDTIYTEAIPEGIKKKTVNDQPRYTANLMPGEHISFSNVIVQFCPFEWLSVDRPNPSLTGTGNADFFMGGKHLKGAWSRADINSRTVFYGEDGNEISLQRGKTLIILVDTDGLPRQISYE